MNELKWMNWKEWIAKSAPNPEVFFHLFVIELVLQSRGHFVDLIFQKCSEPRKFYDLLVKSSSCFGLVDIFVDLIFQKCSEPCSFFYDYQWNRALASVSCTFCRPLSRKKHRVSRPGVLSSVNSRVPNRSDFLLDDDMIDMMMWLPWCWDS